MLNLTWKLFSETGNIDAYLLLKELESETHFQDYDEQQQSVHNETSSANTNM